MLQEQALLLGRAFAPGEAARVIAGERGAAERLERAVHRSRLVAELAGTAILLPPVGAALPLVQPGQKLGITFFHHDAAKGNVAARTGAAKPEHLQRFVTRGRVARGVLDLVEADILGRAFERFRRGVRRNAEDHQRRTGQQKASKHQTLSHTRSMVRRVKPEGRLVPRTRTRPPSSPGRTFRIMLCGLVTIPYFLAAIMAGGT